LYITKHGASDSRNHNVDPFIAIQIGCRHAIDRSLAVAEPHSFIVFAGAVVEINNPGAALFRWLDLVP
jgi:hypothetical protein